MKICSKCKKDKTGSEFYLDKRTKDGLYSCCKNCHQIIRKKGGKWVIDTKKPIKQISPEIVARKFYFGISNRCGHGRYKNIKNLFSIAELQQIVEENWESYQKMHIEWQKSGFKKKYCPSIDRLDSTGNYETSNVEIVPHHENARRALIGIRQTEDTKRERLKALQDRIKDGKHKQVKLTNKQAEEIRNKLAYQTQSSIADEYGVSQNLISLIKNKKRNVFIQETK